MPMRKKPPLAIVGSSTPTGASAERKLGASGQALWDNVTSEFNIDDIGGLTLLRQMCEAMDRIEQCVAQIEIDGCLIFTKTGAKSHPLLRDELALRSFVCRGLTRLGINLESIKPVGRPAGSWTGNGSS